MFPFIIISYLIKYVLKGKISLNCFTAFGSSVCQGSLSRVLFLLNLKVTGSLVQQD